MFQNTFNLMEDLCTRKGNNIITYLKKGKLKLKSSFYPLSFEKNERNFQ